MARRLNNNVILLIVLAVLVVAAGLKAFVFKRTGDTGETAQAVQTLFPDAKKEELTAILIEAPENKKTELVKDGEHWTVASEEGARADQNDVNKVLDAIVKLKKGRVRSSKGENLALYGLDDAKGIKVSAWGKGGKSGQPVAQFVVGKVTDDWRNVFLKLPDEGAVRFVEGSVGDFEAGPDSTWRDKTMFDFGTADQVAKVEITGPKGALVIERKKEMGPKEPAATEGGDAATDPAKTGDPTKSEGEKTDKAGDAAAKETELEVKETYWVLSAPVEPGKEPQRAKKWLCDSIAGYVSKLECEAFGTAADKPAENGLEPPQYTIRVQREGESEAKDLLYLGNKNKDGKFAAMLPGKPQIWWIASWKGDYLTKTVEDLQETPPAKPEEPPAEEKPAEGTPTEEKPTEEKPVDDKAAGEKAAEAKPADGGGTPEKPSDGGR